MKRRTFLFALTAAAIAPMARAQSKPLKIGIIGSGRIGTTFGGLWAKAGHEIMFSDRDPENAKRAAESVGARDEKYARQIGDLTGRLRLAANLNDLGLIRRSIIESAAALKTCVEKMAEDGRQSLAGLTAEVNEYRARLEQFHNDHAAGLIWFLQHEPRVPEKIRTAWLKAGLHRGEFADSGHWPWQIYVRQGRRIEGRARVTQYNFTIDPATRRTPKVEGPIAVGEHSFDVHPCHDRRTAVDG